MLDIPSISGIVAAGGVLVGVVFAVLQLRDIARTRQTDLIIRLYSTFSGKEFQDAYETVRTREAEGIKGFYEYEKKFGLSEMNEVCLFFEGIGVLLHRKLVDISLVEDLFSGATERAWEKVRSGVVQARKLVNDPAIYEYFEYLYNEMRKREQPLAKTPRSTQLTSFFGKSCYQTSDRKD